MYHNGVIAGGVGGGTLASTGVSSLWLILAAFALFAVGTALARIAPRRQG